MHRTGRILGEHGTATVTDRPDPGLGIVALAGKHHRQDTWATGDRQRRQQQIRRRPPRGQRTGFDQPDSSFEVTNKC